MADHLLDEVMRHPEAACGPFFSALEKLPGERRTACHTTCEQDRKGRHGGGEDRCRHRELQCSGDREEASRQREGFDRLRFDDAAEELTRAFLPNLFRLEAECSVQQPPFQQRPHADRDPALQPRHQQLEGDERDEQQSPCLKPSTIEPAFESRSPENPPRHDPERVSDEVRDAERREFRGDASLRQLRAHARTRRQAHDPAAWNGRARQLFADERSSHANAPIRSDLRVVQQPFSLGRERMFDGRAEHRSNRCDREATPRRVWCQHQHPAPPS
jgi:hypothetical protein